MAAATAIAISNHLTNFFFRTVKPANKQVTNSGRSCDTARLLCHRSEKLLLMQRFARLSLSAVRTCRFSSSSASAAGAGAGGHRPSPSSRFGGRTLSLEHFLQRSRALALYRQIVRGTRLINDPTTRSETHRFAREEFERHRGVADLVSWGCFPKAFSLPTEVHSC